MRLETVITSESVIRKLIINEKIAYMQKRRRNDIPNHRCFSDTQDFSEMIKNDLSADDYEIIESILEKIEYPIDDTEVAECLLELEEYEYLFNR